MDLAPLHQRSNFVLLPALDRRRIVAEAIKVIQASVIQLAQNPTIYCLSAYLNPPTARMTGPQVT